MVKTMNFPKVLFLTPCAFNYINGGGITFSNLFRGWPKDRLATITHDLVPVSMEVCENYYHLTNHEFSYVFPLSLAFKPKLYMPTTGSLEIISTNSPSKMVQIKRKILGNAGLPAKGQLSQDLKKWITNYKPDVIYTILGSLPVMDLVLKVSQQFNLPIVTHLMDEGVVDPKFTGFFSEIVNYRYKNILDKIVKNSSIRMGICKKMAEAYSHRFGVKFSYFHNGIMANKIQKMNTNKDRPIICYTGSILPQAQLESLKEMALLIAKLADYKMDIELHIYTPDFHSCYLKTSEFSHPNVILKPTIIDDELYLKTLNQSSVLFLPVNFDAHSIHFIKYSMPTKVPSYLASGTPILVYGPQGVAQVDYALEEGWAKVVSQKDSQLLEESLKDMLAKDELNQSLVAIAHACVLKNHDLEKIRSKFWEKLIEASKK